MTLGKLLIIPSIVSLVLIAVHSGEVLRTVSNALFYIEASPQFVLLILVAVCLQFIGHLIRSKKSAILFLPVEKSKLSTQFRALSIGILFNNLLPFRLGELIRTAILSQKLNISYIYTFTLIVFERALDLIVVCSLVLIAILIVGDGMIGGLFHILLGLVVVGVFIITTIYIVKRPHEWLLKAIYYFSLVFNDRLKNSIRFKFWATSYGLNQSLRFPTLSKYLALSLLMWFCYLLSTFFVAIAVFDLHVLADWFVAGVAPYFGVATPAGPAGLGVFSSSTSLLTNIVGTEHEVTMFNVVAWMILFIPISVVGAGLLAISQEPIWTKRRKGASDQSLANKLRRFEDISSELEHFLEGYFKRRPLSKIVNSLEFRGDLRLVKYFRGGSDAITILTLKGRKRVVKKIISIELKDRLKAQYDWLKKYGGDTIVTVNEESTQRDYYSIDIDYDRSSIPAIEYVHEVPLKDAQELLGEAWVGLRKHVYGRVGKEPIYEPDATEAYIHKHVYQCLEKAGEVNREILKIAKRKKITVNGVVYDNLYHILDKIKKHPRAWKDISTFRRSRTVHGDMILDNMLYSRNAKKVIIIDPAPDGNIINGPVFDFGKAAQSLYCGYEFLLRDETPVEQSAGNISFSENTSKRFSELDEFMRKDLAKRYLTESEQKAILFHAGVLYIRRLKHQVHYTPENVLKFYAVGVRTLNEFYNQYHS